MQSDIGIDLGTGNIRIFSGRTVVLDEPAVLTVNDRENEPLEYGEKAYNSLGRTSDRFSTIFPIERGAISNYEMAENLLNHCIEKAIGNKLVRPRVMITTASGLTTVQERSIVKVAQSSGARNVCLIESPLASALHMGVDFAKPQGTAVIDIGRGTTDVAVITMGGISECESIKIAGQDFDEAIMKYIRQQYSIAIGILTAEKIKKTVGCVTPREVEVAMSAAGINQYTGLPEMFEVTSAQIMDIMRDVTDQIITQIKKVFENTSPELLADTPESGLILTGGSSQIYGMKQYIEEKLNMQAVMPEDPVRCVALGTGIALSEFASLKSGDYRFRTLKNLSLE